MQKSQIIKIILALIWLVLVAIGVYYHVIWRDEMRALSIANAAPSFLDLPDYLQNEGHPILWYVFLKSAYIVFQSNLVLQGLALLFALINMYLLVFKSPFHWFFIALLLFGQYFLFEYVLLARNYGFAATFLFAFAYFARQRKSHLLPMLMLALAAQCNFYAMVFSSILAFAYFVEHIKSTTQKRTLIASFFLVFMACVWSYFQCLPNQDSIVVKPFHLNAIDWSKIFDVGWGYDFLFDGYFVFKHGFKTVLLLAMLLIFIKKPHLILLAYVSMVFMATFHTAIRPNYSQHVGIWLVFFITLIWWQYDLLFVQWKKNKFQKVCISLGVLSLVFTLTQNNYRGVKYYLYALKVNNSNADHLATFLATIDSPNLVMIAENDFCMESVMYYFPKPFYTPREGKFGTYVHFTKANKQRMSLYTLMHVNDSFIAIGKNPILITQCDLQYTIDTFRFSYNKYFEIDSASNFKFKNEYQKIGDFHHRIDSDESYYVYQKK